MPIQAPDTLPIWATDGGTTVEPTNSEKAAGWVQGQQPPARWQNWWQNNVYQWAQIVQQQLRYDWRNCLNGGNVIPLAFHAGAFYGERDTGDIWAAEDGVSFRNTGNSVGHNIDAMGASDVRIVYSRGALSTARYTDDQFASTVACTGNDPKGRVEYLPNSGLWLGSGTTTGNGAGATSPDGANWTNVAGLTDGGQMAENADGTLVVFGDQFSTNQGGVWSAVTNHPGAPGVGTVVWLASLDSMGFFEWNGDDTDVTLMGVPGTWNAAVDFTITNFQAQRMFSFRGALYAEGMSVTSGGALIGELRASEDDGVTWFRVAGTPRTGTLFTIQLVAKFANDGGADSVPDYLVLHNFGAGSLQYGLVPSRIGI